jgi:hypothetical protein
MSEPPASWDQQEEENVSISSTTTKFGNLNVNAFEFVPSFGPKTTNVPTPVVPKTPPSTPVIVRHTNENENNHIEKLNLNRNQIESNNEEPMEEDILTRGGNELIDDGNDSSFFIIILI